MKFSKISLGSLQNVTAKDLTYDGGCMSPLAPGKTCNITLSLWPSNVGAVSAILTLKDDAAGSPQMVAITATVIAPKANVSPSSLGFGNQTVNTTSAAKVITLSNSGWGFEHRGVAIIGENSADFLVSGGGNPVAVRWRRDRVARSV